MKKYLFSAVLCLMCLLIASAACAGESFTIDVDALDLNRLNSDEYVASHLSSSAQGIRVCKYLTDSRELAVAVRLTLTQMDTQTVVLDKDYGYQSGSFDSGVLFLPYAGDRTIPYLVTLYAGDYVYAMPFMQLQRRLADNSACTVGPRLRDLDSSLGGDWLMGTMLDLERLRANGSQTVDICASNSYLAGTAQISMSGERLCVDVAFSGSANAEVSSAEVYIVTDANSFYAAAAHGTGEWIDVGGAQSALLYLPICVSYDPADLPGFRYNAGDYSSQFNLWNENRSSHAGTAADDWSDEVETDEWNAAPEWDGGWTDNGWTDDYGWNEDYGWDDGWNSNADGWA